MSWPLGVATVRHVLVEIPPQFPYGNCFGKRDYLFVFDGDFKALISAYTIRSSIQSHSR
jgi:hypothetical protein